MPDCFISYSSQDEKVAATVREEMHRHGVSAFMASVSVQPGQNWSGEILRNLRASNWVILLASRAACESSFVNQEIGGALIDSKNLIPIVWDMSPSDLPGWARHFQAIDLRVSTPAALQEQVGLIATRIKQKKAQGLLIVGAILFAVFAFGSGK